MCVQQMYIVLQIVCFSGIEKDEVHQPYSKCVIANSIFISHREEHQPGIKSGNFLPLYFITRRIAGSVFQDNWEAQLILEVLLLVVYPSVLGDVGIVHGKLETKQATVAKNYC